MPETYRKGKVESYIKRLIERKNVLQEELERQEFQEMRPYILGQISSLELVINEISSEFCLSLSINSIKEKEECE